MKNKIKNIIREALENEIEEPVLSVFAAKNKRAKDKIVEKINDGEIDYIYYAQDYLEYMGTSFKHNRAKAVKFFVAMIKPSYREKFENEYGVSYWFRAKK